MKISTKGRYGLRALIDIVLNSKEDMVTLKSISERQNISERYLEQIFSVLRKGGIVNAKKGSQGGYYLEVRPSELTIYQILKVLEGDLSLINIEKDDNKIENFLCENLWNEINRKIEEYFLTITLEELSNKYKEKNDSVMYYI